MAKLKTGVRKRDNGTYEKRFTVDGKTYSVYSKTLKELEEKEQEKRKKIESGLYKQNNRITLNDYFDKWIERKRATIKGNSIRNYISTYNGLIRDNIGKRKIQDIEKREIEEFKINILDNGKECKKCNRVLLLLRMILNDAVDDEVIAVNVANKVKNAKIIDKAKAINTIHRALTQEEQRLFMDECKSSYYYEFFAFLLCTGLRSGELSALTWSDIDYKNNVIHISKTVTVDENGAYKIGLTPKSDTSVRDIPLTETAKSILNSYKSKYGNIVPIKNNLVFTGVQGSLISNTVINNNINLVLQSLESKGKHIDYFSAHAFRDTFATRFIEQGGTPQTLKTILGHSNLSITMDLYAHVLQDTKQKEMEKIQIVI